MQRLGLDHATVSAGHDDLIYCSISGFGQTGPDSRAPAYAPVVQALSGFDHVWQLAQGSEEPLNAAVMVADFMAAVYAFGAIQTAVIGRERFGSGAFLDVTLMESMVSMVAIQCQEAQWASEIRSTVFRPLTTRNGNVMIAATLTVEDISARMQQAGLPCARYRTAAEVLADPHLRARRSFSALRDASGEFLVGNAPFRFGTHPLAPGTHVARLGEHTDRVLSGLGFSSEELVNLRHDRVIG